MAPMKDAFTSALVQEFGDRFVKGKPHYAISHTNVRIGLLLEDLDDGKGGGVFGILKRRHPADGQRLVLGMVVMNAKELETREEQAAEGP
jgi:hypothetical protein